MQNKRPVALPAARAWSMVSAVARAFGLSVMIALTRSLKCSIRERKEETTLRHVVRPLYRS